MAGDESKLICPSCGPGHFLRSRSWADVSLMECNRCAGVWLESGSFKHLTDEAAAGGLNTEGHNWPKTARPAEVENSTTHKTVRYRPCAVCGQLMVRQQYGRQSGVIIDLCRFHGIWFDADELPRILDWIRSGGLARANSYEAQKEAEEITFRKSQPGGLGTRAPFSDPLGPASVNDTPLGLIFNSLSRWFFGL
jgi:Zn-finger nucleic acid-binding protein